MSSWKMPPKYSVSASSGSTTSRTRRSAASAIRCTIRATVPPRVPDAGPSWPAATLVLIMVTFRLQRRSGQHILADTLRHELAVVRIAGQPPVLDDHLSAQDRHHR